MRRKNMPGCACCGCCPIIEPCTALLTYGPITYTAQAWSEIELSPPSVTDHDYCQSIFLGDTVGVNTIVTPLQFLERYDFSETQTASLFVTRFGSTYTQILDIDWACCRLSRLRMQTPIMRIYRSTITRALKVNLYIAPSSVSSVYEVFFTGQWKEVTQDRSGGGTSCVQTTTYPSGTMDDSCTAISGRPTFGFTEPNRSLFDGTYTANETTRDTCYYLTPRSGNWDSWSFDLGILNSATYPVSSIPDENTTTTLGGAFQTIGSFSCAPNPNYNWPETGGGQPINPGTTKLNSGIIDGVLASQDLTIQLIEC
jgi:hypothetical protein